MERILEFPLAPGEERARARLAGQRYRWFSVARLVRGAPVDTLEGVERVLVPQWLVRLHVSSEQRGRSKRTDTALFVDAVSGECRALPEGADVSECVTSDETRVAEQVSEAAAMQLAAHGMRWQVLRAGNVHLRRLELAPRVAELVYLPTWLGYFTGAGGRIRVRCVNGIDGGVESAIYAMKVLRGLAGGTGAS